MTPYFTTKLDCRCGANIYLNFIELRYFQLNILLCACLAKTLFLCVSLMNLSWNLYYWNPRNLRGKTVDIDITNVRPIYLWAKLFIRNHPNFTPDIFNIRSVSCTRCWAKHSWKLEFVIRTVLVLALSLYSFKKMLSAYGWSASNMETDTIHAVMRLQM